MYVEAMAAQFVQVTTITTQMNQRISEAFLNKVIDSLEKPPSIAASNAAPSTSITLPDRFWFFGRFAGCTKSRSRHQPIDLPLASSHKPTGSDAVIEGVGENVNFSADELGDYLVELFVSDGALRSESIQTTVIVSNNRDLVAALHWALADLRWQ